MAGICKLTVPVAIGVMSTVYAVPEPEKFEAVPLVTTKSESSNPVTASVKFMVNGIVVALVFPPTLVVITGTEPSEVVKVQLPRPIPS